MRPLLDAIDLRHLRGGVHRGSVPETWSTLPYAVLGQIGGGALRVQMHGSAPRDIADGGGYLIPAGVRFRAFAWPRGERVFRWVNADWRVLGSIDALSLVEPVDAAPLGTRIGPMAEELARLDGVPGLAAAADRQRLGFALLGVLVADAPPASGALARLDAAARLAPVLERMAAPLDDPPTRSDLARLAGLSPTRFHAVFSAALGVAPMTYLAHLRLRRAQELLLSSALGIAEIGAAVGYDDAFHFSRAFKRGAGASPRAWRDAQRRLAESMRSG